MLAALLLHAALLGGAGTAREAVSAGPGGIALQVRSVTLPPVSEPLPAPRAARSPVRETSAPRRREAAADGAAAPSAEPAPGENTAAGPVAPVAPEAPRQPADPTFPEAPEPAAQPAPESGTSPEEASPVDRPDPAASAPEAAPRAAAAVASAPAGAASQAASEPPPVYRTRLAPAMTLDYELRRGMLSGSATLAWRPDADRYDLQLDGSVVGVRVITQQSRGRIDANGLAPERFTDQRARRAQQAANFRRDVGRISFSGPTVELPLYAGVQDRLSWMIQLPGIVAADPSRRVAGQRIVLQAVGARGDSALWHVQVLGMVMLPTRAGAVSALHLRREPRGPYDTRVEVWLDPALHYLPLQATLQNGDEDALELRRR